MNNIKIENEVIVLSLETITKLFSEEGGADAISLYVFYHKQSKIQQTNKSWSLSSFVKKGLSWGDDRFQKAKNILKKYNLIEDIRVIDATGKITGWYVKINYMKTQEPQPPETTGVVLPPCGFQETNAGSSNNLNAGSSNNLNAWFSVEEEITKLISLWNTDIKGGRKTIKITPDLKKVLTDIAKRYKTRDAYVDDMVYAIEEYAKDIKKRTSDDKHFLHRFSLYDFLKQGNGFIKFLNK